MSASGPRQMFQFCANLQFLFPGVGLAARYAQAKQLGFRGVETADPYQLPLSDLKKIKEEYGLSQVLINTPVGDVQRGEVGFASLPGKENLFLESLKQAIDYAEGLNCKLIHIMAGLCEVGSHDLHYHTYVANLKSAVPLLEEAGIVGLIEPINNRSVPNYFLSSYEEAVSVINSVNSKNIGLLLDIFHLQQIRGNITYCLEQYFKFTKHIQVAQVPHRNEPDTPGEINYQYVFDILKGYGYSGWIGFEYRPENNVESGLKWIHNFGLSF